MIVAVDTGGTKTLVALFSRGGEMLNSHKFPTPKDTSEYVAQTVEVINQLLGDESIWAMVVALPGVIRDQKAVVCKNLGWHDFDVLGELGAYFPNVPMWLDNDANLGGVGAANLLSPVPKKCLYVTISTGIGGGFTVDGQVEPSVSENEISDIHFEYNGEMTQWGEIASGRAIMRDFGVYAKDLKNQNDIEEIARRISRGLLTLIPVLRPEVIAIGGGFGAHYEIFDDYVQKELSILNAQYACEITTAPHPEEIVTCGCYFHAKHQLDF